MKTFINAIARIVVAMLLFVSISVVAFGGCCKKSCAPRAACNVGCKLQPEPVTIKKTCDHPGYYKQVCHLEYEPCEGKVEEVTAMPIFKGCYDEQGNLLNGTGGSGKATRVQNVEIQTRVPNVYSR
ncbi:MAG: hypothetical protein AMXMBFR12_08410 [Candidatus Babeliales bacterium]